MIKTWLTETFNIKYPIIMAPMFLVSNEEMLIEAAKSGIMGCTPALNWRTPELFEEGIKKLKEECPGPFGINLIVNKSNVHLKKQIEICEKYVPDFIITSLGSPEEVIKRCQPKGTRIICDVVDVTYAKKVESLGADAIIAVNSGAGGHAGPTPASILVPLLQRNCSIPIISAGGVGTGSGLLSVLSLGAEGVSVGSPFIATEESDVSQEYKDACVEYGAKDIVMSTKVSGTPCTVINTPYVQKIGTEQNVVESLLSKNKKLKKYVKMLTYYKGMKAVENAAFAATYKTVWCAGPTIEFIDKIEPVSEIVERLINEYHEAKEKFLSKA
ncbi:MAG: 2-nitropropane dioxygenase [Halobacteriovorax sp.]|nr:2-nitropropane dioxygenase [Halobacteriovorax sp.]MEE3078111.1 nitronate monooxygenase [Bdellovibrionota bacterium]|tara:strand:- start:1274 stop:2257 length:984 start_codon:yes stop_codon:yes gene_type:complete